MREAGSPSRLVAVVRLLREWVTFLLEALWSMPTLLPS